MWFHIVKDQIAAVSNENAELNDELLTEAEDLSKDSNIYVFLADDIETAAEEVEVMSNGGKNISYFSNFLSIKYCKNQRMSLLDIR